MGMSKGSISGLGAATQAQMETGSALDVAVSPGRAQFHPSAAKAWVNFNGTGTVAIRGTAYNVSSITDNNTGDYTVVIGTDMSSANYVAVVMSGEKTVTWGAPIFVAEANTPFATTGCRFITMDPSDNNTDNKYVCFVAFGDQ